ncbi:hypothetical protein B0A55_05278 [Friedmanniomyces simplex]|uniref:Cupin type-2 domain-containing protein n=1 Tax=Friedmanniomyces simplex TaxID=329884 RepID=A0A4U0X0M6_9PEZI|nr:hypothetical protein B0A55_05278 [Friedmanniomyces simplex]
MPTNNQSNSPVPTLRPCKRYIATHSPTGQSIYAPSPAQVYNVANASFGGMARSYALASLPANLTHDVDLKAYTAESGPTSYRRSEIVIPSPPGGGGGGGGGGANLVVVDLKPGGVSAMHRTASVDFSVCVVGEVEHELDGGQKVRLLPGDHIVQRGTMHRWSNPSETEPARFVACTLPCIPFDIAGEELREVHLPSPTKRGSKL